MAQIDFQTILNAVYDAVNGLLNVKLAANSGVDIGDVDVKSLPTAICGPGDPTIDSYASAAIDVAVDTEAAIVAAPGANKQIWVYALHVMADTAAGTIMLDDEDNTAITGTIALSDEGGFVVPPSGNFAMPLWKVATNKALHLTTVSCTADGWVSYAIVDVS